MYSVKVCCLFIVLLLAGCGGIMDDLSPSGTDKRPPVQPGTTGPSVGQNAPDFTLPDTLGSSVILSSALTGTSVKGVVLYFTMWCPTCETNMSIMRDSIMSNFPDVEFFAIDYVSGSVSDALSAQTNSGFNGSGFVVLADTLQTVKDAYQGTMDITVVIDKSGVIRMNEVFKDAKLTATLSALP